MTNILRTPDELADALVNESASIDNLVQCLTCRAYLETPRGDTCPNCGDRDEGPGETFHVPADTTDAMVAISESKGDAEASAWLVAHLRSDLRVKYINLKVSRTSYEPRWVVKDGTGRTVHWADTPDDAWRYVRDEAAKGATA